MSFINVHTHIFSRQHVPDYVIGQNRWWIKIGVSKMSFLRPLGIKAIGLAIKLFIKSEKVDRIVKFAELGMATGQTSQFEDLFNYYKSSNQVFKFVVLPMDMTQMGAGEVEVPYKQQLEEIVSMRKNKILFDRILPFVMIDPRAYKTKEELLDFVKEYILNKNFIGIKLYPALGYLPFDDKLLPMYEWAIDNNIPIMTHCIEGSIFYQGDMEKWRDLFPKNIPEFTFDSQWSIEVAANENNYKKLKRDIFQRNFTQPKNYEILVDLLNKRKNGNGDKLKICLGHFAMDDENGWFENCKVLIQKYPNFYADISYVLSQGKLNIIKQRLAEVLNPDFISKNKVLFGTDYFVVSKSATEEEIIYNYSEKFRFEPFATINNSKYLSSKLYTF
jgi:uncharacterized protein